MQLGSVAVTATYMMRCPFSIVTGLVGVVLQSGDDKKGSCSILSKFGGHLSRGYITAHFVTTTCLP